VPIKAIKELLKGQQTKVFQQNPIPEHFDLSFSLLYGSDGRTLDVVCKVIPTPYAQSCLLTYLAPQDRAEFELWTTGLLSLIKNEVTQETIEQIKAMAGRFNLCLTFPPFFCNRP